MKLKKIKYLNPERAFMLRISLMMSLFSGLVMFLLTNWFKEPANWIILTSAGVGIALVILMYIILDKYENQ